MAVKRNVPEHVLYDTRLIQRHIEEGLITEADVEAYRQKAADVEETKTWFLWKLSSRAVTSLTGL